MIINYDTFTISIPEQMWLIDGPSALRWAMTMPRNELRFMHQSLMDNRPKLLYHLHDNNNDNNDNDDSSNISQVAEYMFQILNDRCKLSKKELLEYSKIKEFSITVPAQDYESHEKKPRTSRLITRD